ncbi:MAG: hypothetical protein H0T42_18470 [Deltaproteobacteria bacterium]|nr:hypothetical protein [Deltaproteobacteria bacterium]
MALPTSTIVMAVLTCIPFGLAIRETVNGVPATARGEYATADSSYDEEEYAADNARREAEEAAEAELERLKEARKEERRKARQALYGAEVATLGSGFAGISLGMEEVDVRSQTITALEAATQVDVELVWNDKLDRIFIKPHRDADADERSELCDSLETDLRDAWGRGETDDYEGRYWVHEPAGTRASLTLDTVGPCRLDIERFAMPREWANKTKLSIVPMWLVGQRVAKLREHLGPLQKLETSDESVRWLRMGVGLGSGETRLEAIVVKGKVVAITATTNTLETTRDSVIEQLSSLYGTANHEDDGVHWKSRPAIKLDDYEGAGIRVTVGNLPDEE